MAASRRATSPARLPLASATDKRQAVKVEVPGSRDDSVKFGRVGIIAAVGFAIGIAWPRLAGVKLVPSVPVPAAAEASARELTGAPAEPKPPEAVAPPPSVAPSAAAEKPPAERLLVSDVQVASCRNEHGKRSQACDRVDFDRVAREPLRSLSSCAGTEDAAGVLSLGFDLDFQGDKIKNIQSGKSTSLEQDNVDRLLACARERFANVSLAGIPHEQKSYTLYYRLELLAPAGGGAKPGSSDAGGKGTDEGSPASGTATVSWDVALVRANPARDGEVRARVLSGTRVVVTGKNGDWFRVKYDAKGNQGWVYRTAIGM
ncbi:MAG TPA: SH3 domain-containing protein [Polyangiaceae bacterium]|nr:SH3 domain-containing protein [Polyangiaceae bacterium]